MGLGHGQVLPPGSLCRGIVNGHDPVVRRQVHIDFHPVTVEIPGQIHRGQGVLRRVVRRPAVPGDLDTDAISSNTFEIEWPPRSGRREDFPEVDRAAFYSIAEARIKLNPAQVAFIERLEKALS